jgi:predicted transglutaminase-like cysteine proteinase
MSNYSHPLSSAAFALAIIACTAPAAHAAMPSTAFSQTIAASSFNSVLQCYSPLATTSGPQQTGMSLGQTKSAAILGGTMSKLELMRLNQSGQVAPMAVLSTPSPTVLASSAQFGQRDACIATGFAQPGASLAQPKVAPESLGGADFLSTKRLRISRTTFDSQWSRVLRQGVGRATAAKYLGPSIRGASEATLVKVNSWTNRRVKFAEDRDLYGRSDYWASANSTLKRGAGDCEDIAIVKMQLLAALGVPRSDMYLTITRDLVRNADHAVLIVKVDERFWLLDNSTDTVLDGSASHDYRPIYSFGVQGRWLHGYSRS